MGGAFTAIANNDSAMYFNPSGMVDFESNKQRQLYSIELGTGGGFDLEKLATQNDIKEVTSSTFNYFVAGAVTAPKYGVGMAVYSLYSVRAEATDSRGNTGYKDQDISALSGSVAYAITDQMYPYGGKLSVGATLGMAFSGGGLINYTTTDGETGATSNNYDDDTLDQRGFFYDVGVKARVFSSMTFNVDLGANYRSSASLSSVHEDDGLTSAPVNGMDMPSELAYGIAAMYLTEYGVFTLSADKKTTGYEEATSPDNSDFSFRLNDYDTVALGVDFSGPSFQLRAGTYKSEEVVSGKEAGLDISGYTIGGGFIFSKILNLDLSVDQKTYLWGNGEENSETFASLSLNIAFEK